MVRSQPECPILLFSLLLLVLAAPSVSFADITSVSLNGPANTTTFISGNAITFNWTAESNLSGTFDCNLYVNGTLAAGSPYSTTNATPISDDLWISGTGTVPWYVECSDDSWATSLSSEVREFTLVPGQCLGLDQNYSANDPINESCDLNGDMYSDGNVVLRINNGSIVVNCAGYAVVGGPDGVYNNGFDGVTVEYCNIENFSDSGVKWFNSADNGIIFSNSITSFAPSTFGVYIDHSSNNAISENIVTGPRKGILIYNQANHNNITSNFLVNTSAAFSSGSICEPGKAAVCLDTNVFGTYIFNNTVYNDGTDAAGIKLNTPDPFADYGNSIINNTIYSNFDDAIYLHSAKNNTVSWNNIYGGQYGIHLDSSADGNTLDNNYISNLSMSGIYMSGSSATAVTHNLVTQTTGYDGIDVIVGFGTTLSTNAVMGSARYGVYVSDSTGTTMSGDYLAGNGGADFAVSNNPVPGRTLSLSGVIFDNPAATSENYTTLSLTDNLSANEKYNISWSAEPATPPTGAVSVNYSYVRIEGSAASLGNVTWSWDPTLIGSLDENKFSILKYSGGWSLVPATRDTATHTLTAANFVPASVYGIFEVNDSSIPDVALNAPANGTITNNASLELNFTATDADSSSLACDIYLNGVANVTGIFASNGTVTSAYVNWPEGLHTWFVNCTDMGGNSNVSDTWELSIDLTPPAITIASPANDAIFSNPSSAFVFNFTVTDNIDTNITCDLYVDNADYLPGIAVPNDTYQEWGVGIPEGIHTWYLNCTDDAGNWNVSDTRNFTMDNVSPSVTLVAPPEGFISSMDVLLNFTATDDIATSLDCTSYLDGVSFHNYVAGNDTPMEAPYNTSDISDGYHNIYVNCSDEANNTAVSATNNFTLDSTPPSVALDSPPNGYITNATTTIFNFTASDNLAANLVCYLDLNGSPYLPILVPNATVGFYSISTLTEGFYSWFVNCSDEANNSAVDGPRNLTIDFTAPITGAAAFKADTTAYTNNTWTNQSVVLNLSCNDATSGCNQTLYCITYDGSACTPTTSWAMNSTNSLVFGADNTTYYIYYMSEDNAGNYELPQEFVISIDTTGPIVAIQSPQNAVYNASSVPLAYTTYDASSGVSSCSYVLDGAAPVALPGCANTTLTGLAYGVHNITVISMDVAGNSGNASVTFTVLICPGTVSSNFILLGNIVNGSTASACINAGASNIVIDCAGYVLNGTGSGYGVEVNGFNNVTLKNCVISHYVAAAYWHNNAASGSILNNTLFSNVMGIDLNVTANNLVSNNTAYGNSNVGVMLGHTNNTLLSGNNASNNLGNGGVYAEFSNNVTFSGDTFSNNSGYGAYIIASGGNTFLGNAVMGNSVVGVSVHSTAGSNFTGNNVSGNGAAGGGHNDAFYFDTSNGNNFANNVVSNNSLFSFELSSSNGNTFTGNAIARDGIYLDSSGSNTLTDNNFTGVTSTSYAIGLGWGGTTNNTLVRNILSGAGSSTYGISIWGGAVNNLFINNTNLLDYAGTNQKFNSNAAQNINSSGNKGWWPFLHADGSSATSQAATAWYNGTAGGRNADGSANPNLAYWYNNLPLGCVGATKTFKCGDTITESCAMNWDDLNWGTTCFTVGAHNIMVDCAGHTITGTGSGSGIIDNGYQNVTVQNCVAGNFLDGFNFNSANGAALINDTAFNNMPFNSHGFVVSNTLYAFITQSTAYNINTYGFEFASTSNSSMVNNTAHNVLFGLYLGSNCQYDTISSNNAYDIGSQAYAMFGSSTRFNGFIANTARNITGGGVYGTHGFQFDNAPNNTVIGNNVSFSAGDGFNLDHANGNVLVSNMEWNSTNGAMMNSSNSTLLLGNTLVNNTYGIYFGDSYNCILAANNASHNSDMGLYNPYPGGDWNVLAGNAFDYNGVLGAYMYASYYNNLTSNSMSNNSGSGLVLALSGNNNVIGNTFSGNAGNGMEVQFVASANNYLLGNTADFNAGDGILLIGAPNNVLESNFALNNTLGGIYINKTPDNQTPDNTVLVTNVANGNGDNGIYVANADNLNVTSNTASQNHLGGITLETVNVSAISNTASGNTLSGLWLHACPAAQLQGNIVIGNGNDGMALYESPGASVIATVASGNTNSGITLDTSSNSLVVNNTASANVGTDAPGIYLWNSTECTIEGNTANGNIHGIAVWDSPTSVAINGNTADGNNQYGIGLYGSTATLTNNEADGNSFGGGSFLAGIGLFNSSLSTLINNTANSNAEFGIGIAMSPNSVLINNTANGNANGTGIVFSDNPLVQSNTLDSNSENGLVIALSANPVVTSNTANGNHDGMYLLASLNATLTGNNASANTNGITLDSSANSTFMGNTINDNSNMGAYFYYSDSGTIEQNVVNGNGNRGIDIEYSNYNTVRNNSANDSGTCIYLTNTLNSTISYNNLTYCNNDGLDMYYTNYTSLFLNSYYGDEYGIYFDGSHFNTVQNETILESVDDSFDSGDSTNNLLQDIYISSTSDIAHDGTLYLYDGFENNTFNRITVNGTAWAGFYFTGASNNLVENCTMTNDANLGAFYFDDAYNNTVKNCAVDGNGRYGFYFTGAAANNSIYNSTASLFNASAASAYADGNSSNKFMNTTFNRANATVLGNGTIFVYWYARALVEDMGSTPLYATRADFTDGHGTEVYNQTNFFAYSNYFEALQYSQQAGQVYPATVNSYNDYTAVAFAGTITGSGTHAVDGTTTIIVHLPRGGGGSGGSGGGPPIGQNGQDYGPYGYSFQVCSNPIAGSYSYSTFVNSSDSPKRTVVTIVLSNSGTAPTHAFLVRQPIPAGTVNLHNVSPSAVEEGADYIVWNITPIAPGDSRTYTFTIWNLYAFDASYPVNYTSLTPIVDCTPVVINTTNETNQTANITLYADLQVLERVFVGDQVNVTVVGDDGAPIPGAKVVISGPEGTLNLTADSNGSVSFTPGVSGVFSYLVQGYVLRAPRATVVEPELPPVTKCTQDGDCGPGRICVSGVCTDKPVPIVPPSSNNCLPMVGFVALAGVLGIGFLRGRSRLF